MVALEDLPAPTEAPQPDSSSLLQRQQAFGYTFEDLNMILAPMGRDGVEPIGSMGNDTPLAVLSQKPQPLYNYFQQLFAQVTNPPIDALREEIVIGTGVALGSERNLLNPEPESCRLLKIPKPILTDQQLATLRHACQADRPGLKAVTLSTLFRADAPAQQFSGTRSIRQDESGMTQALDALCAAADRAVEDGASILILSDRGVDREHAAIPALLALAGVHHHLVRQGSRTRVGLVVESGEPPRGASLCGADRLRRGRDQSLSRLRNPDRYDPPGPADRCHA